MAGNKIYVQGSYIDVHDNENVYLNVDKAEVKVQDAIVPETAPATPEELVERLRPIFYNNEEDVRLFLKETGGMRDSAITDLVNRWVADSRISNYANSRKGDLWAILHEAGIYTSTRQNWNRRVK